jgi:hypothetical protein
LSSTESPDYATAQTSASSDYESLATIPSESEFDAEVCSTEFVTASEPSIAFTMVVATSAGSPPVVIETRVESEEGWVSITPLPNPKHPNDTLRTRLDGTRLDGRY